MPLKETFTKQWKHVCGRGLRYWLRVAVLIAAGIYLGHKLEERELWAEVRYRAYQWLEGLSPKTPSPDDTAVVLINDEEYWLGEPRGREPIQRDYLAKLVAALDTFNPAVIALDFDLRSPSPEGQPVEIKEYEAGTQKLCEVVRAVSQRRKVVLPKTIHYKPAEDALYRESDVYNNCDFGGGRVSVGYIALPDDLRRVPLDRLEVKNGDPVDSFSQAIARAYRPQVLERLENVYRDSDGLPFGGFIHRDSFDVVSANQLFSPDPAVHDKLSSRIVILSGEWHSRGLGRGPWADSFHTPVGAIPGALLHANYVEAMLDKRVYSPWGGWARLSLEIIWSLLVAVPFALEIRPWQKFLAVAVICVLILFFSYVSLVNLGLFYDFFIPTLLIIAHGTFEQVCEWRAAARKCARDHGGQPHGGQTQAAPPQPEPQPEAAPPPVGTAAVSPCLFLLAALALAAQGCGPSDSSPPPTPNGMATPAATNSANTNASAPARSYERDSAPPSQNAAVPSDSRRLEKKPSVNTANVGGPRRNRNNAN